MAYKVLNRDPNDLRILERYEGYFYPQEYTLWGWKTLRHWVREGDWSGYARKGYTSRGSAEDVFKAILHEEREADAAREARRKFTPKVYPFMRNPT